MIHKTQWIELFNLVWRCDGCFIRCQTFGKKPEDNNQCDESLEKIRELTFGTRLQCKGGD